VRPKITTDKSQSQSKDDTLLHLSSPFINSQQNSTDDSFNSLQLSGNILNTQNGSEDALESNSEPSLELSPTKSSFENPTSSKVNAVDDAKFSQIDIFNPGKEILEATKGPHSVDSKDSNESPEAEAGLQFELSQDFSQVLHN